MSESIERLVLPRTDWYDSQGRIYKDALIENFNAIEDKCNEMLALSAFEVNQPDFSEFEFDDTTLDSPENKIVNLKSFMNIMNLAFYPLTLEFNGTKLTKLEYINDQFQFITVTNRTLTGLGESGKNYIYLRKSDGAILVTSSTNPTDNHVLLGRYDAGRIYHIGGLGLIDVNVLQLLSALSVEPKTVNMEKSGGQIVKYNSTSSRIIGYSAIEDGNSEAMPDVTLRDLGRK